MRVAWLSVRAQLLGLVRAFRPVVALAHHPARDGDIAARSNLGLGLPFVTMDWEFTAVPDSSSLPLREYPLARVFSRANCAVAVAGRRERDIRRRFPQARDVRTVHSGVPSFPAGLHDVPRPPELRG